MILFLTSSPYVIGADRALLSNDNEFVDRIRAVLPPYPRALFIAADPENRADTCRFGADTAAAFSAAGMPFQSYHILDSCNAQDAQALIGQSDLILLSGGHVPTQNAFFREIGLKSIGGQPIDWNRMEVRADKVYYLPPVSCNFCGITFLRNGLYLGDLKKNRFEPSQPLALALRKGEAQAVISLSVEDPRLERYLKGETLIIEPGEAAQEKGWHLLCVQGYPLGFGKLVGQTLKNKYPAGWRV